jgi:hypothetical protein
LRNSPRIDAKTILPGQFFPQLYFYSQVTSAYLHPVIQTLLKLKPDQLVNQYCNIHPEADPLKLQTILAYHPRFLNWAGSDFFLTTDEKGRKSMLLLEMNSCPAGQKSMPIGEPMDPHRGYGKLVEKVFIRCIEEIPRNRGGIAVIFDKNVMEASGYAATIADILKEPIYLTEWLDQSLDPGVCFDENGIMQVRGEDSQWHNIRAAFRYVTQRPWNRIPINTKTLIFNPIIACLAGGRNKLIAAKAYEEFNTHFNSYGLKIQTPHTIYDVQKEEVPFWVNKMGGSAIVKVPYSNAGQGIYILTNEILVKEFISRQYPYEKFIIQNLIGKSLWHSQDQKWPQTLIGTVPDQTGKSYAFDLRIMIGSSREGYILLATFARRAKSCLCDEIKTLQNPWDVLGTNLSRKKGDTWEIETNRLLVMNDKDFAILGLTLDDFIEAFIQTVLAAVAIDQMAQKLITEEGNLNWKLFQQINPDPKFVREIVG